MVSRAASRALRQLRDILMCLIFRLPPPIRLRTLRLMPNSFPGKRRRGCAGLSTPERHWGRPFSDLAEGAGQRGGGTS